jgi:hypothetical protein
MNLVVIAINEVALGELEEPTIETISEPDAIGEEHTLRILIKVTGSRPQVVDALRFLEGCHAPPGVNEAAGDMLRQLQESPFV